jgi:Tellurite resistance protein TehB
MNGHLEITPVNREIEQIPLAETSPHSLSFADPNGRMFWWGSDLYRGIFPARAGFYSHLFDKGIVQQLVEMKLLVETERTDLALECFGLVVKHRQLPIVSYAFEWPSLMLKEAALAVLDLEIELLKNGLGLQDCHPWNVLFDGTKPVFVDFGSIVKAWGNDLWEANGEFFKFYVYPLQTMARGNTRIARWLLHDHENGISQIEADLLTRRLGDAARVKIRSVFREAKKFLPRGVHSAISSSWKALDEGVSGRSPRFFESRNGYLRRLRERVENIETPTAQTGWSSYYNDAFPQLAPSSNWNAKHNSVYETVRTLKPQTVLDIAANCGWYSMMVAQLGVNVVATDLDEECINQLFRDAKAKQLQIQPLVLDFCNPSPGIGINNQVLLPATERLKCEMVLALALVHHLVFSSHMTFDQIAQGLAALSVESLLVEFVPKEDLYVRDWWTAEKSWYTIEEFKKSLQRYYDSITLLPSYPNPRVLLLCER